MEQLTITKLLELIKSNSHPDTIIKLATEMRKNVELSKREFQIISAIYSK